MDTTKAWDVNAAFWDARMGEGNDFHKTLVEPHLLDLLRDTPPPKNLLDIGCGNGHIARNLHILGYKVTAFDGSSSMIEIARSKSDSAISYYVINATDQQAMEQISKQEHFDAAICNMVLMDINNIKPLFKALRHLLANRAPVIFSVCHPCFNRTGVRVYKELREDNGNFVEEQGIKITRYQSWKPSQIQAMMGQPEKNLAFDRTFSDLFKDIFACGFVIDALRESSFPKNHLAKTSTNKKSETPTDFSWQAFPEIPPALIARAYWI